MLVSVSSSRSRWAGSPASRTDVYGTALLFPEFMPELKDWSKRYLTAFGVEPGSSTVEAYDAVNVALDAIKRAGTVDHEAVRKAISDTNMASMSGPMSFNRDGTRTAPRFLLLHARKSGFQLAQ
jgi:branched-chain amino acid transport system substrate-binding protein